MIGNEIISHIKHIQEAARQNRLVVFVGAGASASAGVPTWSTLINEIKNELPLDVIKNETDYLKIAQLYKEQRGEKEFLERIQDILRVNTVAPSLIHDAIINLNPCHIITTNYDNLLEQAILRNNKRFHIVRHDEDMPYNHGERMLIKMHGEFESRRIVLTENDYYDYELNYPLIRSFIISLFASKLVLFVGFSFNDSNIKYIFFDWGYPLISKFADTDIEIEEILSKYSIQFDQYICGNNQVIKKLHYHYFVDNHSIILSIFLINSHFALLDKFYSVVRLPEDQYKAFVYFYWNNM